jgi:hypothetical protein
VPPVDAPEQAYTATLELSPSGARVGARVRAAGQGYPPHAAVELIWHTFEGRYELERGTEFVGQALEERSWVLATTRADGTGRIDAVFDVPLDFGGTHDVRGRIGEREVSQAALTVHPTVSLSATEGPVGAPLELRIVGLDWRANQNVWHVLYDNKYLGFVSGVTTRGVAVARFRAAGPVGDHVIGVWRNAYHGTPYLAPDTSPFRHIPGSGTELVFRATHDPGAPAPYVEDFSATDAPWPSLESGPGSLATFPDRGTYGQPFTLQGINLPPNTELAVRWWTTVGNRITDVGMVEEARERRTVRTDAHGRFVLELEVPDDLGGQHKIDVVADGRVLAATGFVVLPALHAFEPRRVRAGEKVAIRLKGLGWTTYDNTYTVTYDNAFIGYVCGFSTGGDVPFTLTAVGGPGTHLIDLYPTIYKARDPSRMPRGVYSVPQLTYADDHPQRRTPAVRLAIEIVP